MHISNPTSRDKDQNHRSSIHLLLNPSENSMLPPLSSLNLLTNICSTPQHYQDHNRFRHQRHQYKHHSGPSSPNDGRSSRSTSPIMPSHSNVPYTLEQVHFIQYHREDKGVQWQAIVQPFKRQFPRVVFQGRGKGALECRYYRAQMYPKINDEGNFVRDHNGDYEMTNVKVRERPIHQHRAILDDYIKLVTRCPEYVEKYSWTDEEDKKEARRIIEDRAQQGVGSLPGAVIHVRPTSEGM